MHEAFITKNSPYYSPFSILLGESPQSSTKSLFSSHLHIHHSSFSRKNHKKSPQDSLYILQPSLCSSHLYSSRLQKNHNQETPAKYLLTLSVFTLHFLPSHLQPSSVIVIL
ncbi:unnamed protein product [Vicia faba]|uniref:Uncharacterized protein n=1 Tax=Vicia faba TaxID=3906 RepID=A0AAV1A2G0_VICFA|nr:unnamed protein product [Vicia faba]